MTDSVLHDRALVEHDLPSTGTAASPQAAAPRLTVGLHQPVGELIEARGQLTAGDVDRLEHVDLVAQVAVVDDVQDVLAGVQPTGGADLAGSGGRDRPRPPA